MKTIGLQGGMSWESAAEYYRIINQVVNEMFSSLLRRNGKRCMILSMRSFAWVESTTALKTDI